jgi:hypothetical protein
VVVALLLLGADRAKSGNAQQEEKKEVREMKQFFVMLFILLCCLPAARAQDLSNPERPAPPGFIQPAPPAYCANGNGWVPTCNPVNDVWCWDWCGETKVSFADVYANDGQKWAVHWLACGSTVELYANIITALEADLMACKKKKGGRKGK